MSKALVYHGSPRGDIELFEPVSSSHRKPFVYASLDKAVALMFIQHGGGDFVCSTEKRDNKYILKERFHNALKFRLGANQGYVYTLPGETFYCGTSWGGEVVSTESVRPLTREFVANIFSALEEEEKSGRLTILRWSNNSEDIRQNEEEVFRMAERYHNNGYDVLSPLKQWHPHLVEKFQKRIIKNPRRLENL